MLLRTRLSIIMAGGFGAGRARRRLGGAEGPLPAAVRAGGALRTGDASR